MSQALRLEQREHDFAGRTEAAAQANGSSAAPPITAPQTTNDPPMRPIYRPIEAGEQRTEGLLEGVACLAQGALLEVRLDGALLKFFVPRLDQVDFISYRPSLTGAVKCGARTPPDHVYVTWREPPAAAPADVKGRAVAVEFLPK